ncbi:MAG TPA: SDR family oxidoreductase [Candidatus Dormibacteraeota bacterium]
MAAELKVALVTGGGSGIGRAVAITLAENGYSVVIAGRREIALEAAVAEAAKAGLRLHAVPTDVREPGSVHALFARIKDVFGRLDLLFNNAGVSAPTVPLEELGFEHWKQVVDTNLTGAFLCAQEAFRLMKNQHPRGGRIINNGSTSAHTPRPNSAPYTATKHAITGLTRSLSLDGRRFDIACGQIDLGNVATEMTKRIVLGARQANGDIAAEPAMDVLDVARAVVFMANLPLDANVQFMTVMPTRMPFIGRG